MAVHDRLDRAHKKQIIVLTMDLMVEKIDKCYVGAISTHICSISGDEQN